MKLSIVISGALAHKITVSGYCHFDVYDWIYKSAKEFMIDNEGIFEYLDV